MIQELLHDTPYEKIFAKGMQIVERRQIVAVGRPEDCQWGVQSQTREGRWYGVCFSKNSWKCTCEAYTLGHKICSHVVAAFILGASLNRTLSTGIEVPDLPTRWCRFCGSTDCSHTEYGTLKRMTECKDKNDDQTHKYRCHKCKRKFVDRPGFVGLHFSERVVLLALGCVAGGQSAPKAAQTVYNDKGVKVSGRNVQRWVERFSDLVDAFTSMLKLPNGIGAMSVDEKHFKSQGKSRYMFETMNVRSRYIISHDTAHDKLNYDATKLFQNAVKVAGIPLILLSDKLRGFRTAHKTVMCAGSRPQTLHYADAGINKKHVNNNRHERRNGTMADLISNRRGFNSDTPPLLILGKIFYNFVDPHTGIGGKTPAEVEGIIIPGRNKIRTLIRCAVFTRLKFV